MQKEENDKIDSKRIDIQPHAKVRSRRARQLAQERAKTRFDGLIQPFEIHQICSYVQSMGTSYGRTKTNGRTSTKIITESPIKIQRYTYVDTQHLLFLLLSNDLIVTESGEATDAGQGQARSGEKRATAKMIQDECISHKFHRFFFSFSILLFVYHQFDTRFPCFYL